MIIAILALACEVSLRLLGITPANAHHFVTRPKPFFVRDSLTGWSMKPGKFSLSKLGTDDIFEATIDANGNRNSGPDTCSTRRPEIQVYGCEFTFGFSIPDSASCCYKLQTLLPQYKISNKAVISYGLTQMFLSLQESLQHGDTPQIAVFNYGSFQDMRTPLHHRWSAICRYTVTQGDDISEFQEISYPYFDLNNDTLALRHTPLEQLSGNWPLTDKFATLQCLNSVFYMLHDLTQTGYLHRIAQKTSLAIMEYCRANHITPVFATVTPEAADILDSWSAQGFITLNYGISIKDSRYNGGKIDPGHPNSAAHTLYANKLYQLLLEKKLIK